MLRIVDYAKRSEMEWYEVLRLCINERNNVQPIAIPTNGELRVFELDDDKMIGNFPGQEPIQLAYCICCIIQHLSNDLSPNSCVC